MVLFSWSFHLQTFHFHSFRLPPFPSSEEFLSTSHISHYQSMLRAFFFTLPELSSSAVLSVLLRSFRFVRPSIPVRAPPWVLSFIFCSFFRLSPLGLFRRFPFVSSLRQPCYSSPSLRRIALVTCGPIQEMARASEKCWLNTSTTTGDLQAICKSLFF